MPPTQKPTQTVFRRIERQSYTEWPAYDSMPLYDRTPLAGVEEDVNLVADVWFEHEAHDSLKQFVCSLPLAYFRFEAHDRYTGSTRYEMETLF